jgi:YHS domain-containing protein
MNKAGLMVVMVITTFTFALGQSDDVRKRNFNIKKNLAIEGYDPVSYFDNKPLEGKEEIRAEYKGVTYFFATTANLTRFKASPEKYEPSYGGWCAYAMGESGEKVKVDPETFKVIDGKLYLFYNSWGNNTLTDWNKNEKGLKTKADQNWKKFIP